MLLPHQPNTPYEKSSSYILNSVCDVLSIYGILLAHMDALERTRQHVFERHSGHCRRRLHSVELALLADRTVANYVPHGLLLSR